jgi:hypothetical protein
MDAVERNEFLSHDINWAPKPPEFYLARLVREATVITVRHFYSYAENMLQTIQKL